MREEHVQEDQVLLVLRALAENDRERQASPKVEARLLGAFTLAGVPDAVGRQLSQPRPLSRLLRHCGG
jgi:hypothetical protein